MKSVLSTYQVANLCNVHLTTVINWVNEGVLPAYTTPGGHRRIKKEDFLEFAKKYQVYSRYPPEYLKHKQDIIFL